MNVDILNIFMMIASLILAVFIPVELLILSYAFLGPFHYLTEINWLEDKSFFVKGKKWVWILVVLSLCLIIPPTISELIENGFLGEKTFENVTEFLSKHSEMFLFFGLALSLILVFINKNIIILGVFIVTIIVSYVLYEPGAGAFEKVMQPDGSATYNPNNFYFIFAIFLPTIIHVYLFTGLFMLYGALRGKSKIGIASVILLFLIPFFIFNMDLFPKTYEVTEYGYQALKDSNFSSLNQLFIKFFGGNELALNDGNSLIMPVKENGVLVPNRGEYIHLKTQVFIAFAYIYHYLNWFSKTTVIKWHKSFSTKRVVAIVLTYIVAIALYLYDFKTGFIAMFFLSFLHVLLEFPLNVVSVKGIGQEIAKRFSPKST